MGKLRQAAEELLDVLDSEASWDHARAWNAVARLRKALREPANPTEELCSLLREAGATPRITVGVESLAKGLLERYSPADLRKLVRLLTSVSCDDRNVMGGG